MNKDFSYNYYLKRSINLSEYFFIKKLALIRLISCDIIIFILALLICGANNSVYEKRFI